MAKGTSTLITGLLDHESPQYKRKMALAKMLQEASQPVSATQPGYATALQQIPKIFGAVLGARAMAEDDTQRAEAGKVLLNTLNRSGQPNFGMEESTTAARPDAGQPYAAPAPAFHGASSAREALIKASLGSDNEYLNQLGQVGVMSSLFGGGDKTRPTAVSPGQSLVDESGNVLYSAPGKAGEGFSLSPGQTRFDPSGQRIASLPGEVKAPSMRTISRGGVEVQQEWTGSEWRDVGSGPRWNPNPTSSTNVNVTLPGEAKIPESTRAKYAEQRAMFAPIQAGLNRLEQHYSNLGGDYWSRAGSAAGIKGQETAAADSLAEALRVQLNVAYGQGAIAEGDYKRAVTILPKLSDVRLGKDALLSGVQTVRQILSDAQTANEGRIATVAPEKAPEVKPETTAKGAPKADPLGLFK